MDTNWHTRNTLLQRARNADDEEAWFEFVHYYEKFILKIIRQVNVPSSDVDDVVQEILVKVWKNLSTFEPDPDRGKFRTWLGAIIRNTAINRAVSKQRYVTRLEKVSNEMEVEKQVMSASDLERTIERDWRRHITACALETVRKLFSGSAIKVFELSMKGFSNKEIGREMDIKEGSVRMLKSRVQKRLIAEIQRLRSELEL